MTPTNMNHTTKCSITGSKHDSCILPDSLPSGLSGGLRFPLLLLFLMLTLLLSGCASDRPETKDAQDVPKGEVTEKDVEYAGLSCVELEIANLQPDRSLIMDRYLELREIGKSEGYVPLIVFEDEHVLNEMLDWGVEEYGSLANCAKELLQLYPEINVDTFFSERHDLYQSYGISFTEELEGDSDSAPAFSSEQLASPAPMDSQASLYVPLDTAHLYIAKIPVDTERPYEVLAYVPFGGYNDCPLQEEHLAVAKRWFEAYGAIPCAVSYDTLQFYLDQPLTDDQALKTVSEEMFLYCLDIVDQGVGTMTGLKQSIYGSPLWFFWWD